MKKVGILYDSVSLNTGDMAIGIALEQALERRGIEVEDISPYDAHEYADKKIIIGGGQLLRDPGDDFYDYFRLPGHHILNSAGVSGDLDFSYLDNYEFISARTTKEAEILQAYTDKEVAVLPCTTTVLKSKKYKIPGLSLKQGEKVVGIHLVPDSLIKCPDIIRLINEIPHKKVFIPFTHYNRDESFMRNLPIDKSNAIMLDQLEPLELHSVISQMSYTIVSSLHATIFSYTQNVPFVTMYQKKTLDYLADRGLDSFVFNTQAEFEAVLMSVEMNPTDMRPIVRRDAKKVNEAIDSYVKLLRDEPSVKSIQRKDRTVEKDRLEIQQLKSVVEGRDVLLHNVIYQHIRSNEASINQLQSIVNDLNHQLQTEKDKRMSNQMRKVVSRIRSAIK